MLAAAMHLVLLMFLVVGVDWLKDPVVAQPKVEVVQAKVIDEQRIKEESERLKKHEQEVAARQQAEKSRAERELEALKAKQQAEKKRLLDIENKRKLAEQTRIQEKARIKAEEKKRKAEEAKRRAEENKKKAEAKKKEEARKRAEAEKRKKAEAERKRKAQQDAERKRLQDELQQSLAAEQNSREIALFSSALREKVTRNWLRPPGTGAGLRCKLRVRVSTSGTVLGVQVVQSSGNPAFDRSAESAVYQSDPLPQPPAGIRELDFYFDPDR